MILVFLFSGWAILEYIGQLVYHFDSFLVDQTEKRPDAWNDSLTYLKIFKCTDAKKWKDTFEEAKMIVETQCELYAKECK
jgi:hypothetical protein